MARGSSRCRRPDLNWTDQAIGDAVISWDDFGSEVFYAVVGAAYRLTGGTAGAVAFKSDEA